MEKAIQIAIDGPASSGKSTIAKYIAEKLNYIYLDTGAMYRVVTYAAQEADIAVADKEKLVQLLDQINIQFEPSQNQQHVFVNGKDVTTVIRTDQVSQAVSDYAALPYVREKMVAMQREYARKTTGIVMDGRDIGTVVLPDAEVKIFLTASAEERAKRRYKENQEKGYSSLTLDELISSIKKRDKIDSTREESPLIQAEDAIYLDSSQLSLSEVEQRILQEIEKKCK